MTASRVLGALLVLVATAALVAYYLPAKRLVDGWGLPPLVVLAGIGIGFLAGFMLLRGRGRK